MIFIGGNIQHGTKELARTAGAARGREKIG